jgi:hypothetical protein
VKAIITAYHKRIGGLEEEKYDLEYEVAKKVEEVQTIIDQSLRLHKTVLAKSFIKLPLLPTHI